MKISLVVLTVMMVVIVWCATYSAHHPMPANQLQVGESAYTRRDFVYIPHPGGGGPVFHTDTPVYTMPWRPGLIRVEKTRNGWRINGITYSD